MLALAGVALAMTASGAAAAGISIRELGAEQLRVATIGYRIAAANAQSCARPEMMSGIISHDLTQYPAPARALVSRAFSIRAGFGVLQIVPGSAADRAGLKIDDEIVAVGDARVEDQSAVERSRESYDREDRFLAILSAALAKGPTQLLVRRAGELLHLTIQGQSGCGGNVVLSTSSNLNAWSDGRRVLVTTAMMQQAANDDELAFVIAHEMAHNILGHAKNESMGLFGMLGFGSARVKSMEVDADSYAVPLMNAAGYSPFGGISFLESASRRMWWSDLSLDHPSFGRRIRVVIAAIGRLPRASGTRLAQL
ncbi:MAG TPA: M48 family metalloprotease [Sphingomicrobium sp.]|jgi:membrane-associated protease RseP (regulator of RpoE activity)|nr:M48 family metalloprotease [Sphingomicrobium sp.]